MGKLLFAQADPDKTRGTIVGGLWPVPKVKGYSLKFKTKVKDDKGVLQDITGQKLMDISAGDGFLILPNGRKRADKRDPDFIVIYNPDAKPYKK
jgi:hypothetical protein